MKKNLSNVAWAVNCRESLSRMLACSMSSTSFLQLTSKQVYVAASYYSHLSKQPGEGSGLSPTSRGIGSSTRKSRPWKWWINVETIHGGLKYNPTLMAIDMNVQNAGCTLGWRFPAINLTPWAVLVLFTTTKIIRVNESQQWLKAVQESASATKW
jgi:hypothetical protein